MKKIVVMPVKNEAWIIEKTLQALSLWADNIIIADQNSTDGCLEIYKKFPKVIVINNPANYHSSNVRKLLLEQARKVSVNSAIFSFDADEIPTVEILQPKFWQQVEKLPIGSAIEMQWVQLWRSAEQYRDDALVWSNSWKVFGFIDDPSMEYDNLNVINDHTSRVPQASLKNVIRFSEPKVLHYQFTNWQRMLVKQVYYRIMELIKRQAGFWQTLKINLRYRITEDERGLVLKDVPETWVKDYELQGISLKNLPAGQSSWFEQEIAELFNRYGVKKFSGLDIWDNAKNSKQKDPRGKFTKWWQGRLDLIGDLVNWFRKQKSN